MNANETISRSPDQLQSTLTPLTAQRADSEPVIRLHRWLVYFASGSDWSRVGEYVATDAAAAIHQAVEVFGSASDYQAEMIPWDCAPLFKRTR
jgi:hypothetical protein